MNFRIQVNAINFLVVILGLGLISAQILPFRRRPTSQPTVLPTLSPSSVPTLRPSFRPSSDPTTIPTSSPTYGIYQTKHIPGSPVASQGATALSADGSTIVVGSPSDSSGVGAIWIFRNNWNSGVSRSTVTGSNPIGASAFGSSVAISEDGRTMLVGAPKDNNGLGAAYLFSYEDDRQLKLTCPSNCCTKGIGDTYYNCMPNCNGCTGNSNYGSAVAMSRDGNTLAIAGIGDNNGLGAIWVVTFSRGKIVQVKLVGTGYSSYDGSSSGIGIGFSLSMSQDGQTILAGGPGNRDLDGGTWVFKYLNNVWAQNSILFGSGFIGGKSMQQGRSVSVNADGTIALVSSASDNEGIGTAWVFKFSNGVWSQNAKLVGSGYIGSNPAQGNSVAISSDGKRAILGGLFDNNNLGAAWLFADLSGNWTQIAKLVGTGSKGKVVLQGSAVSMNYDGSKIALTGSGDDNNLGAVWAFSIAG